MEDAENPAASWLFDSSRLFILVLTVLFQNDQDLDLLVPTQQ